MSRYPIKMLKDESGQPFVPLTHIMAVTGEEYTTAVLIAHKLSTSHYQIVNDDLNTNILKDKIIAVKFDEIGEIDNVSYLKINNDAEHPFYKSDGLNPLILSGLDKSVCLFTFNDNKWKLTLVGTDEGSSGGHAITDYNGNVMTQRSVLNFDGATVKDDQSNGATKIITNWAPEKVNTITGNVSSGSWTNLLSTGISIPMDGYYKIHTYLSFDNLTEIGKEIGVRVMKGTTEIGNEWKYQYKRLRGNYTIIGDFNKGDTINPQIYIDNLTSTNTSKITSGYVYIEYIPKRG